jgi:hypothetical protein
VSVGDYYVGLAVAVTADPRELAKGNFVEWAGVLPVGKMFKATGMLLKYVGAGMSLQYTSKLLSKSGRPLEFILEKTGQWGIASALIARIWNGILV